jgi:hypothetical protein
VAPLTARTSGIWRQSNFSHFCKANCAVDTIQERGGLQEFRYVHGVSLLREYASDDPNDKPNDEGSKRGAKCHGIVRHKHHELCGWGCPLGNFKGSNQAHESAKHRCADEPKAKLSAWHLPPVSVGMR